jgi:hypothetical protein
MRLVDPSRQMLLVEGRSDPGDKVVAISHVIDVLQLASAAFRKVTAWRHLVVSSVLERPIIEKTIARHSEGDVPAALRDAVSSRGDSDDLLSH